MFAKLFQKFSSPQNEPRETPKLPAQIAVHYGIPATASILAFDPIQQLLAIGTSDGRIKVVGGDNIEGLLVSPKPLPFKNLEFLQNQGFLVSISNENDIQVWDLASRHLSSKLKWESNITAFSVIYGTHYMYLGDEYGYLSVLKYDAEERNVVQLPYYVPPNLVSEIVVSSIPNQLSIVGLLPHPCSFGNRVLIAYENGLLILWDITEDRAVFVSSQNHLQPKEIFVCTQTNMSTVHANDSKDHDQEEKEISSLCWLSSDGSILAVGYVDGDIFLWNLSVPDCSKSPKTENLSSNVVKLQLLSGDRRLPVTVLHCSANKSQNSLRGYLFVYGGGEIGAEEVLTILKLDWSSGLAALKCIDRVDLRLSGSFADIITAPSPCDTENDNSSLFILTNPGQLHYYDKTCLSTLKSERENKHNAHSIQYPVAIPTINPCMTVAKSCSMDRKWNFSRSSSKSKNEGESKWPLTGGVPSQLSLTEDNGVERIHIAGYQDGSVRIWDATYPVLSLMFVISSEVKGIESTSTSPAISALDFSSSSLSIAIGNEYGLVHHYMLGTSSGSEKISLHFVTETKSEVHFFPSGAGYQCKAIFSLLNSPVCILKYIASGSKLIVGFESSQVAVLDVDSPSVLFLTDCVSSSRSPITSLSVKTFPGIRQDILNPECAASYKVAEELAFALTRDGHIILMDSNTGNVINSQPVHPDKVTTSVSLHILAESNTSFDKESDKDIESKDQSAQSGDHDPIDPLKPSLMPNATDAQILVCCEDILYLFSLNSVIQGNNTTLHEVNLVKPCCWTALFKNDDREYGLILVYRTGDIEIRTLPDLKLLGDTSLLSVLRWNFKTNVEKTMSSPSKGIISLVHGCEFAILVLCSGNDFRIPQALPCLHDKVLAATKNAAACLTQNERSKKTTVNSMIAGFLKGFKGDKGEQDIDDTETRETFIAHLEKIFSRFPFSDPLTNVMDDQGNLEINLDDIEIDDPIPISSSSHQSNTSKQENERQRQKLFEGGSTETKPRQRTREEIIAKYRNKGDAASTASAASAAAEARNKLHERGEKLEQLSERTAELQNGAEDFASLAKELAKKMEKRKWWNL
ncbi:uncharacterized protein LOC115999882 isoform X1 [Ipomoea triloba]|uniref:uncharacterized protein LOC115999882 isoform X1 n=1 Tax=Ipomoea triloba TaxID=35885 RepID=UPI00125D4CD6|nr:uncharacterized protein LOC115999882 isoform X1 [Ipomoea triloba]